MNISFKTLAWILYDFANSAYVLIIPAVAFPLYYQKIVLGGAPDADRTWGIIVAISLLLAGLVSPFIGALTDSTGRRRAGMTVATLCCVFSTIGLSFVPGDMGYLNASLFIIGQVSWVVATLLYDSFLKTISDKRTSNFLSGLGWGIGYAGGILCLVFVYPLLKNGFIPENLGNYRLSFLITGLFYLIFSMPALLSLPARDAASKSGISAAYVRVFSTLRNWKSYRTIFFFLLGFYLLSDGITTVIYFTSIFFAKSFSMPVSTILLMTVIIQAVGIVMTPLFGLLADGYSEKRALLITVLIWCVTILMMSFWNGQSAPIWISVSIGLVVGSSQAICRAIYAHIVPIEKQAEFFGFNAMAGRVATLLGPLVFGVVSSVTGNQRLALSSLLVFFLLGGIVIARCKFNDTFQNVKEASLSPH